MNRGIQPGIEGRLCGLCKANTIIGAYGTAPAAFDLEEAKLTPTHPHFRPRYFADKARNMYHNAA